MQTNHRAVVKLLETRGALTLTYPDELTPAEQVKEQKRLSVAKTRLLIAGKLSFEWPNPSTLSLVLTPSRLSPTIKDAL